jgi:hypothetical protein
MTRKHRNWGIALAILLALAAALYVSARRVMQGAQAYLFGYPLVIMDVTREGAGKTVGPPNQLHRLRKFPDASFRAVVRPNVDTLYTIAFIDADAGPWVFTMPPNDQRYELMPFMDAWTDVFTSPGTRTVGTQGGRYLIVGPRWQGQAPDGMTLLRAPTQIVWLLGRTQTNGAADYDKVHALQDGLKLEPLNPGNTLASAAWQPDKSAGAPIQQMQQMDTGAFFGRLARLMVNNPPRPVDAPMVAQLASMGIAPGQPPQWSAWQRLCFDAGRKLADWRVAESLKKPHKLLRGWFTPPVNLANFGTDYATRAGVAMVGLGANLPADAVYPNAHEDEQGEMLNGSHRYRLHFAADALPPVKAFWSVTAYGADDFLIDNPLNRYALGDRDKLQFNPDGSLDIWVQAQAPTDASQQANWLPVRAGETFTLNARLYWPKPEALDGRWGMPAVQRLD